MRNLLRASDRDRLVGLLTGPLAREVMVGGTRLRVLADGEEVENGVLCTAAANARAAELLLQPEIREANPALADGVLDFLIAMAEMPEAARYAVAGGIEVTRGDPRDFEVLTPFHRFSGDLFAGQVRQQIRRAAGPGPGHLSPPVLHSGNLVEFRLGRHRACVDVEDHIVDAGLRQDGSRLLLWHESLIRGRAGLLRARAAEAGRLRYEYEIAPDTPLLRLTVTFRATRALSEFRLTTALDSLDADGLAMTAAHLGAAGAWRAAPLPSEPGLATLAKGEAVEHLALGTADWPAGALAVHLRPAAPERVTSAHAVAERGGNLHWLLLRHGSARLSPGEIATIMEHRLLAVGTSAEAAARQMTAAGAGLGIAPAPGSGAALHVMALALLLDRSGAYRDRLPPSRRTALEVKLDHGLTALAEATPGLSDLALAVSAAEARRRLHGGQAAPLLRRLLDMLGARQDEAGLFREPDGTPGSLAAHAQAILALARVAWLYPARLAPALESALQPITARPVEAPVDGTSVPAETLLLAGAPPALPDHAEAMALVARAMGAVTLAAEGGALGLSPAALAQAHELHRRAIGLLRPLVRPRDGLLEVMPSPLGGAPGTAAQAAVTLALLSPEARTMRLPAAQSVAA